MSTKRERVGDAAIGLLGTEGLHALTHLRVDAAAELPRGSTSNYFRTRAALVHGVVERLEELDRAEWARLYETVPSSADSLVDALTSYVHAATGANRVRTIARYTLFMESIASQEIQEPLLGGRTLIEQWGTDVFAQLGATDAQEATRATMATLDGLILHRLALPVEQDPRPHIRRVALAYLTGPGEEGQAR